MHIFTHTHAHKHTRTHTHSHPTTHSPPFLHTHTHTHTQAKKQEQLSRSASAKGEHLIHKATIKSQQLKKQATVEDSEASHLVVYAKKLAQKMVKEEALDEMKKWMKANAATAASNRAERPVLRASRVRHAHRALAAAHAHAKVRTKVPLTALHARRSVRMAPKALTEGDKIRNEFGMWRTSQLTTYAHDHDLYTKTQYCNSRATAHSPSISELQRAFGTDWQDVPPRVASLAAVNGCMEALGLRARHSTAANLWEHGALKGKADAVRECAHGNNKVRDCCMLFVVATSPSSTCTHPCALSTCELNSVRYMCAIVCICVWDGVVMCGPCAGVRTDCGFTRGNAGAQAHDSQTVCHESLGWQRVPRFAQFHRASVM